MSSTLKSIGAILVGLIAVVVLSTLTDVILESTGLMQTNPFDANPVVAHRDRNYLSQRI